MRHPHSTGVRGVWDETSAEVRGSGMRHLQRLEGLGLDIRRGLGDLANTPIRKHIPIAVVDRTSTGVWNEISTGVWESR